MWYFANAVAICVYFCQVDHAYESYILPTIQEAGVWASVSYSPKKVPSC